MMTTTPHQILSRLPKVRDMVRIYGLVAQSKFGQNFIFNQKITDQIAASIQPDTPKPNLKNSITIEIGPGPGMLTRSLIRANSNRLLLIEKDSRFLPILNQLVDATDGSCQVLERDVLHLSGEEILCHLRKVFPFQDDTQIHLVGNLPFNISTPYLLNQIKQASEDRGIYSFPWDMTFMFQKEVAERIVAPPHSPHRSRLSVIVQAFTNAERVMEVRSDQFVPQPKVSASVVHFRPKLELAGVNFLILEKNTRYLFSQKRKTIRNNLSCFYGTSVTDQVLTMLNVPFSLRPQDLSTQQVIDLAISLNKYPKLHQI